MSHLRDLQRLRNTRNNFQLKRNSHHQPDTRQQRNKDPYAMPEIHTRNFEMDFQEDGYTKYLNSK